MSIFSIRAGLIIFILLCNLVACINPVLNKRVQYNSNIESYVTFLDQSFKLEQVEPTANELKGDSVLLIVNSLRTYQTMEGFGFTLTGGSAQHFLQLSKDDRQFLLEELFGKEDHSIGVSYLRISLGSSDLDEKAFSYNDIDPTSEDLQLNAFTLKEDENDLIPILKEILLINPNIKIMASPWSPPAWMKTNKSTIGGSLKSEYFEVYAKYFVKYIETMATHGIRIDAITIQNEPLHPGNNPSLYMTPKDQAEFIKNNLGPEFNHENINTKIVIYDHNADRIDYPISVLNDQVAKRYIDGTAFHLYGGEISNLDELHQKHPDKNIYFTEQWVGAPGNFKVDFAWHMKNLIIGASRNWCKTVLEWNLSSNLKLEPHTPGGCTKCLGALTIDDNTIHRNTAYYVIAHASKFVPPGSKRIYSTEIESLPNVAFLTPEGEVVIIALNESKIEKSIYIELDKTQFLISIEPESSRTYIFKP